MSKEYLGNFEEYIKNRMCATLAKYTFLPKVVCHELISDDLIDDCVLLYYRMLRDKFRERAEEHKGYRLTRVAAKEEMVKWRIPKEFRCSMLEDMAKRKIITKIDQKNIKIS